MILKNIPDLQRRYGQIGFDLVGKELRCEPQIYVDGVHLCCEFYADAGKLSFVIDMQGDIDLSTLNMNCYTGIWQANVQIEPATYESVSTVHLENRFRQLSYMADTGSEKARVMMEGIKADLRKLSQSKKQDAVRAYHQFLARYGVQFQLAEPQAIATVRLQLQQQYTVQRKFSLLTGKMVAPLAAYHQLAAMLAKAIKKH